MIKIKQLLLATGAALAMVAAQGGTADAQSLEKLLKVKKVSMYISSGAGGTYDAYARIISRHIGRHLPGNPRVLPRNMPGASGLRAAKYLYRIAAIEELWLRRDPKPFVKAAHQIKSECMKSANPYL